MRTVVYCAAVNLCSVTRRSKIRRIVCRSLRGAVKSARSISSIQPIAGVNTDVRGGNGLRGGGIAFASAASTVRRETRYRAASVRADTCGSTLRS